MNRNNAFQVGNFSQNSLSRHVSITLREGGLFTFWFCTRCHALNMDRDVVALKKKILASKYNSGSSVHSVCKIDGYSKSKRKKQFKSQMKWYTDKDCPPSVIKTGKKYHKLYTRHPKLFQCDPSEQVHVQHFSSSVLFPQQGKGGKEKPT